MADAARRFWLTVLPGLTGLTAGGVLVLAALFPTHLFAVGSRGYLATAAVALVSLGVLVWQLSTSGGTTDSSERL